MMYTTLALALRSRKTLTINGVTGRVQGITWEGGDNCWNVTLQPANGKAVVVFVRCRT